MRLEIASDVCTGHGRCYTRAPKLIDADDEGFPVLLVTDVPAELAEDAQLAARSCPERAITLAEAG